MEKSSGFKLGRFAIFLVVGFILYSIMSAENKGDQHKVKQAETAKTQVESDKERIERLASVDEWFYDRPNTVDPKLKKSMGKDAKNYREIVSAAAYRVAARANKKINISTTQDGKTFLVNVDGGGRYEIELADLKDKDGRYYNAEEAATLPDVETQHEKWMKKACAADYDPVNVKELLRKNSAFPSTVDVDWFTSQQDLGVYKDGTREISVKFQNKNAFGVEMRYIAIISISPKCIYKVKKLEKY